MPKKPPETMATSCLSALLMNEWYRASGISRPTKWPHRMKMIPMWNRLLARRMPLGCSIWLEPVFQVYWARSKRAQLPIRQMARAM
ncbi:hypothetical protein D3C77_757420 [compost metagenome]